MDFKVVLMPAAIRDLEEITRRLAKEDKDLARQFGDKLIDQTLPLAQFPEMGRVVPEFGELSIREIIHGRYRIVYRVRKKLKESTSSDFGTPHGENLFFENNPTHL